jgi:hypothetical protein
VCMVSLCTYRVYELIKFIKLKNYIFSFHPTLFVNIQFQVQIFNNKGAVKKINFLTYLKAEIFLFLL